MLQTAVVLVAERKQDRKAVPAAHRQRCDRCFTLSVVLGAFVPPYGLAVITLLLPHLLAAGQLHDPVARVPSDALHREL